MRPRCAFLCTLHGRPAKTTTAIRFTSSRTVTGPVARSRLRLMQISVRDESLSHHETGSLQPPHARKTWEIAECHEWLDPCSRHMQTRLTAANKKNKGHAVRERDLLMLWGCTYIRGHPASCCDSPQEAGEVLESEQGCSESTCCVSDALHLLALMETSF